MQEKKQIFSPIKQNILYFVGTLSISKRDFYKITGISRGTLESPSGITEETLVKFIATYPNISLSWLILGKGEMTTDSNEGLNTQSAAVIERYNCKLCEEKERAIRILEKALANCEKVNAYLEQSVSEYNKRNFKQTGT